MGSFRNSTICPQNQRNSQHLTKAWHVNMPVLPWWRFQSSAQHLRQRDANNSLTPHNQTKAMCCVLLLPHPLLVALFLLE